MNKVYACSDLHGMYNLWAQIRDYCDETDTIYFLGDAADRGPDGLKIIKELLTDKRVIYIKGNHEDMLVICASELLEGQTHNLCWWYSNGGQSTQNELSKYSEEGQRWFINKLNNLPHFIWYKNKEEKNILLSHAGIDLGFNVDEYKLLYNRDPYLWDRTHIGFERPLTISEDVFQVHGHTPVVSSNFYGYNRNAKIETIFYNKYKYCIDMGAFATYKVALIDLDTFETKYFYDEISAKENIYE